MDGDRAADQGAIEEFIAPLAGGFSDQLTAMAGGAMGGPDVVGVVGVVLGTEGIVAAEQSPLKGLIEVTIHALTGFHESSQGAF